MSDAPDHQTHAAGEPRPAPKRVLLLGATGMLGRSWRRLLEARAIAHDALARPQLDLMRPQTIREHVTDAYDLVVNAAAWTDVDGAESDEAGATRANAHAVEEIAALCARHGARLITYSTDYVFSGHASSPYPVDAPIDPVNAYGRSKALGERLLADAGAEHLLIRTSWVYAPWGKNFVRTIRSLAFSRDELSVVDDQRGRPTSATRLAENSLELYLRGALGAWHLCDGGECSWFQFAQEIVARTGAACLVSPCPSDAFPRPAKRPAYSTLDLTPTEALLGPLAPWRQSLQETLEEIARSEPAQA